MTESDFAVLVVEWAYKLNVEGSQEAGLAILS
jgi:hypothetical protein